jgi:hypothetical protein
MGRGEGSARADARPNDRTPAAGQARFWAALPGVSGLMNSWQSANWVRVMAECAEVGTSVQAGQMLNVVGAMAGREELET